MKKKRILKLKYKKILLNIAILSFLVLFCVTFFPVGRKIYDEKKLNQIQEILLDSVIEIEKSDQEPKKVIDFPKLKALNSDVVGWIEIPNTNINYAIVKGKDNSYYLNHDTLKNYNIYGSIFMHYQNKADFQDNNTILFGHNTYKDTLFAELIKIYDGDLGNDIKIIIYTEKEKIEYQVYASYIANEEDETPLNIHTKYYHTQSNFQQDVPVTQTLTLSTCYKDDTKRIIVHARRLNTIET